jgi:hypothetical protein
MRIVTLTYVKLISKNMKEQLTLFPVASLVSHSHSQENEKARMMNATCGAKCYEQFKKLNRDSSSPKMSLVSRVLMADWYSNKCALTWKMKGTKYNRLLFQLVPKTLRTEETDAGSLLPTPTLNNENGRREDFSPSLLMVAKMLPTPTAMMDEAPIEKVDARNQKQMEKGNSPFILGLGQQAMRGLLPTPTGMVGDAYADNSPNSHLRHTPNLATLASKGMLPTPATRDYKGANSMEHLRGENGTVMNHMGQLPNYIKFHTGQTSQLNPRFVAEMMGFPPNWTELPFQNGEQNQLKDMGTL